MTTPRSMFTEAIEDHLALKKQNAALNAAMPLAAFDVGDPLERYPGGPVTAAGGEAAVGVEGDALLVPEVGPDPAAAVAAADELVGVGATGEVVEGEFRQPLQPLSGMTPMLSLVEDVEDEDDDELAGGPTLVGVAAPSLLDDVDESGSVLRFPGGVGPRMDEDTEAVADTGEQPVIVIDADEPLAPLDATGPAMPTEPRPLGGRIKRPTFFGLRRGKKRDDEPQGDGWFANSPRDFDWS